MFDCHVHTRFSTDCSMNIEEAMDASRKSGIGLIITEHMDLNYPVPEEFVFDIDKYFACYNKHKSENLLLGMELGMDVDSVEKGRKLVSREFDFVIGSIHEIGPFDIYSGIYEGKDKKDIFEDYFKYMHDCVERYDYIDTLGHIDFICRYAKYPDREIYYQDYADLIDEVLKTLSRKEKSIEINTRRLNDISAANNLMKIYKRFHSLGGKTATIGSDAHSADYIGSNLSLGYNMARECGLRPVYYRERRAQYL